MPAVRVLATILRISQLAFSAAAVGLTSSYLYGHECTLGGSHINFIYVEIVTALGLVFSLLLLIPAPSSILELGLDFALFILLLTAFGLITTYIGPLDCGSIWDWCCITGNTICQTLKADIIFCFLAAIFFLVSGLFGIWRSLKRKLEGLEAATSYF
ncbi:hypothetical protein OIDMADRAFT_49873 [Oidiodendron maius Zn]|uniref:MARVEL domain-containing protein n=1 Tax=Oidiodendron maius (strain Zn) TaxID=913774 RepID=A0A0C3HDR2_OIDMZ|nr:hypothetical protein OIDMADRAFT_49873 [Oidiodendron maius Zn]